MKVGDKIGDYEIIHIVNINNATICVGDFEEASFGERYMGLYDDLTKEQTRHIITDSYAVAMEFFGTCIAEESKAIQVAQLNKVKLFEQISNQMVEPIDDNTELLGQVVVLAAEPSMEFKSIVWHIRLVVGGGHHNLRCARIYDGGRQYFPRSRVLGILKKECYPEWVVERLKCVTEGKQKRIDWGEFHESQKDMFER